MNTVCRWSAFAEKGKEMADPPGHACFYDSVACMCVWLTDLSSLPLGMQPLKLMVGQLCERHLCPRMPSTHTHIQAGKVHWKSAPMLGLMGKSLIPLVPHTFNR